MKRFLGISAFLVVLAALVAGGVESYERHSKPPADPFQWAPVTRGDLVQTISATGTVEPEEVIDVGAQVAGQIVSFGKDSSGKPIDCGSVVETGTVLAQVDDSLYRADVAQANAELVQAQANVQRAEADLGELQAKLDQAERDWDRAQKLGPSNALAQSSYDAYKAAYQTAKANLAVGEATVAQNKGAVVQAQAGVAKGKNQLTLAHLEGIGQLQEVRPVQPYSTHHVPVVGLLGQASLRKGAQDVHRLQRQ